MIRVKLLPGVLAISVLAASQGSAVVLFDFNQHAGPAARIGDDAIASFSDYTNAGVQEDLSGSTIYSVRGAMGAGPISLSLTNSWSSWSNLGFGNRLLDDYLWMSGGGPNMISTTGWSSVLAPSTIYALYVFGYGDAQGQNSSFTFNGVSITPSNDSSPSVLGQDGRYARFEFRTGPVPIDEIDFSWDFGPGGNAFTALNGFAVVAVPEPAMSWIWLVALLPLARRRRT